ncbi:MAG: class I SAM-dependent methyltransferase [Rhodocyclaceae bacterium]|jgi:SAM-dependent methyltransferase
MSQFAHKLKDRFFRNEDHPYRLFETKVQTLLLPEYTLLDAGCGRTAPVLSKYKNKAHRLIGVDLVDFTTQLEDIQLIKGDLGSINLPNGSVDLIMARSVMEHVVDPAAVYGEMHRLLKPGGYFVFLTANLWDYASLIAKLVPNRFHPWIVSKTEGRLEEDVFPIQYKTNTRRSVEKYSRQAGFDIVSFEHLGQYPAYFLFNAPLFALGTLYEKIISRFDSLAFLRGWILVVLRRSS